MSHAIRKRQNIDLIYQLLRDRPDGFTRSELAKRIGVNRATITKYMDGNDMPFIHEDGNKLKLDRLGNMIRLTFDLDEITMLHVATRLLARQTNRHNPHAASALRKLSQVVHGADENISRHISDAADRVDSDRQMRDVEYLDVLRKLTEARTRGFKLKVHYELEDGTLLPYTFCPYFIEPYAPGLTTHVIGWREPPGALRTFKVERLRQAEMLMERYTIPPDFEPEKLLEHAWGIWYTDEAPVEVALKFASRVRRRVKETRWHRNEQSLEDLPDGGVIWRCQIAEPREMLPWIRGWGADVEVLQPEWLREELVAESRRLAKVYGVSPNWAMSDSLPSHWLLWGKTGDRQQTEFTKLHLLIYHLLDVGCVTSVIWERVLTEDFRQQIADSLGLTVEAAGRWISFFAALHDLGKACPAFQAKFAPRVSALKQSGFNFDHASTEIGHGTVTALSLGGFPPREGLLVTQLNLPELFANKLAMAIGGHHGLYPTSQEIKEIGSKFGGEEWDAARKALFDDLRSAFAPPHIGTVPQIGGDLNALLVLISGLVSVADWIGSMRENFPYHDEPIRLIEYVAQARRIASRSLDQLGWTRWQTPANGSTFSEQFDGKLPRPTQQVVINLANKLNAPSLVLIEDATGSGKTEAGFYLADYWARILGNRGTYIAMPTMATSNQMWHRYNHVLQIRYGGTVEPLLVHGQARFTKGNAASEVENVFGIRMGEVDAMAWFSDDRKRSLLVPFGVGTVDQSLMAVLQTPHFFVRLFALGRKTIIFDEVHAYDTYMTELFERLLTWLRALGSSVIILSATLPASTRRKLATAFGANVAALDKPDYPALTWVSKEHTEIIPLPKPVDRKVQLRFIGRDPMLVAHELSEKLAQNACVAIICNRVARAQEMFLSLHDAKLVPENDLVLFHARFPTERRNEIEQEVLSRAGKDSLRDRPFIVVATQVIEQSLDLDFDLIVSDYAPIDLLIQRIGRLHRHERIMRPNGLREPSLWLMDPEISSPVPSFGSDEHVYDRYMLLRSWLELCRMNELCLPSQTRGLIEDVYAESPSWDGFDSEMQKELAQAWAGLQKDRDKERREAEARLVATPSDRRFMTTSGRALNEDDPQLGNALRALTRLAQPSITVVCLAENAAGLYPLYLTSKNNEGPVVVSLTVKPDRMQTGALMRAAVNITRPEIVREFARQDPPSGWQAHSVLSHCRPIVFINGTVSVGDFQLTLTRELGLQIEKLGSH